MEEDQEFRERKAKFLADLKQYHEEKLKVRKLSQFESRINLYKLTGFLIFRN
jgi:hypothetical protein